jgi:hypothetical protein
VTLDSESDRGRRDRVQNASAKAVQQKNFISADAAATDARLSRRRPGFG